MSRWKALESESPIHRVLSSRNVMLLAQPEKEDVWPVFGIFIKKLIETNVLDINSLSDQCVALFRQDWPVVNIFNSITNLINVDYGRHCLRELTNLLAFICSLY